jgi:hypothetical protein
MPPSATEVLLALLELLATAAAAAAATVRPFLTAAAPVLRLIPLLQTGASSVLTTTSARNRQTTLPKQAYLCLQSRGGINRFPVEILVLQLPYRYPLCLLHSLQQHEHSVLFSSIRRQLLPQQRFNSLVKLDVILGDECDGATAAASPGSSAHAMHIVFAVARDFEVDDEIDAGEE